MRPTTSLATFVAFTLVVIIGPAISARAADEKKADAGPAVASAEPLRAAASIAASGTATVLAVDPDARVVVLKTGDGDMIPVKCGKDVVNFDQIKAGDEVRAIAAERVIVYISKEHPKAPSADGDSRVVMRNAEGERPGFVIADTTQATAKVEAIDAAAKTVTLVGASGKPAKIGIGPDVDLSRFKQGDEVTVRATSGIALSVARPGAPGEAQPAGAQIGAETRTATVESVDREERLVTLKTAEGKTRTIQVGGDAVNFDQVEPGDQVRATVAESVAVSIDKADAAPRPGDRATIITTAKGGKPGMIIAATKRVVGKIDSIDPEQRLVSLTPADGGKALKFKATPGLDIAALKAGDQVQARVTDSLAIVVEKPAKTQP